jgi:hypothetical protein
MCILPFYALAAKGVTLGTMWHHKGTSGVHTRVQQQQRQALSQIEKESVILWSSAANRMTGEDGRRGRVTINPLPLNGFHGAKFFTNGREIAGVVFLAGFLVW